MIWSTGIVFSRALRDFRGKTFVDVWQKCKKIKASLEIDRKTLSAINKLNLLGGNTCLTWITRKSHLARSMKMFSLHAYKVGFESWIIFRSSQKTGNWNSSIKETETSTVLVIHEWFVWTANKTSNLLEDRQIDQSKLCLAVLPLNLLH